MTIKAQIDVTKPVHNVHIDTQPQFGIHRAISHQPICTCGWKGAPTVARTSATREMVQHLEAA